MAHYSLVKGTTFWQSFKNKKKTKPLTPYSVRKGDGKLLTWVTVGVNFGGAGRGPGQGALDQGL